MTTPKNILREQPQREDSLDAQLLSLIKVAEHQGCHEAALFLKDLMQRRLRRD